MLSAQDMMKPQHSLAEEGAILERLPEVGGVAGGVDALSGQLGDPLQRLRGQLRAVLAQNLSGKTASCQICHALLLPARPRHVTSHGMKNCDGMPSDATEQYITTRRVSARQVISHRITLHHASQSLVTLCSAYSACCLRVFNLHSLFIGMQCVPQSSDTGEEGAAARPGRCTGPVGMHSPSSPKDRDS